MPIVQVNGRRSGTSALTWGQRSILRIIALLEDDAKSANIGSWARMPDDTSVEEAIRWIGHVVETYESLRTRFVPSGDDQVQVLDASGEITVPVTPTERSNLTSSATEHIGTLRQIEFDLAKEWPIRFTVLATGDQALAVVWASSHAVLDMHGMRAFNNALTAVGSDLDPAVQPIDQAAFEASPEGVAVNDRAVNRLYKLYREHDADPPYPRQPPLDGFKYWYASFNSTSLPYALKVISDRYHYSTSVVLFAAFVRAFAAITGRTSVALSTIAANRNRAGTPAAVGTYSLIVPLAVDTSGADWPELLRRTSVSSLGAYRFGAFDVRCDAKVRKQAQSETGAVADFSMCFNDARGTYEEPERVDLHRCGEGSIKWTGHNNIGDNTVFLWIWGGEERRHALGTEPGEIAISLMVDTTRVSLQQAGDMLLGVERVLVEEASIEP